MFTGCNNQEVTVEKSGQVPAADYQKDTVKTREAVSTESAETAKEQQQRVDFGIKEKSWLTTNLRNASELKNEYWKKLIPKNKELMPIVLDEVFTAWMADTALTKSDTDFVINSLGAAFGQWLVDHYQMKWIVVTDANGTGYAVIHEKGNVIAYPPAAVKKAIDAEEEKFMFGVEMEIKDKLSKQAK